MTISQLTFEEQAIIQMKRKNLTMTQIAKSLNISIPYVSDIIKGNRNAETYKKKICEILEIPKKDIEK